MRLAACYTIFNGIELLEKSMHAIRDHVDMFVLCYQNKSNRGQIDDVYGKISHLDGEKVLFTPDLSLNTKENERRKHQLMLDSAYKLGATHAIMLACDHFYMPDEFAEAKKQAENFHLTFTEMFTYFKHPTWQLTPIEDYYMPFIVKLPTKVMNTQKYPLKVDPSVRVSHKTWKLLDLKLHHYSMVREDVMNKFRNSAAGYRWGLDQLQTFINEYNNYDLEKNPGITYFKGRKVKVVPNYFDL